MIRTESHKPSCHRRLVFSGCFVVLCLSVLFNSSTSVAADPQPEFRQIFVPAEKPSLWPKGNWQPIPTDEYRSILKGLTPVEAGPQSSRIEQMKYSAVLIGNTLRNGTLRGQVSSSKSKRELLFLEPLNLAVSQLRWTDRQDREADWGSVIDGRTALLVNREQRELQGRWTLQGRGLPRHVQFDMHLMPATVSQIRLKLPGNRLLKSSVGDVRGPSPSQQAGWNDWEIELGSQTHCQLTIVEIQDQKKVDPVLFCEQNTSYIIRQADLQFQVDLNLEVLEAPVQQLTLSLPLESQIYSVTYGSDTTLERKQTNVTPGSPERLTIMLPDPLLGKGRTIRIRGISPVNFDKRWVLPKISLENSFFTAGQFVLRVAAPLELRMFNSNGFRQIDIDTDAIEGQVLTFEQLALDASFDINVGYRNLALSSKVFTHVDSDSESWNLKSEIHWQARSGSTFSTECKIPPQWEITDVRSSSESAESELADWAVEYQGKQNRKLILQFRESLNPENPKSLLIFARRLPVPPNQQLPVPVIEPLNCDDVDSLLSLAHSSVSTLVVEPGSTFEVVGKDNLAEIWNSMQLWEQVESTDKEKSVSYLLKISGQKQVGQLRLHVSQQPVEADISVNLDLKGDMLTEKYLVQCRPVNASLRRLLVYLTTTGPSVDWRLIGGIDNKLEARMLPNSQHYEWNVPAEGELWEIYLPFPHKRRFRIGMSRSSLFKGDNESAIAIVPSARQFSGTLVFDIANDIEAEFKTQGLQQIELENENPVIRRQRLPMASRRFTWNYESAADVLKFQLRTKETARRKQSFVTLELDSLILSQRGGFDSHRARFSRGNEPTREEFQFELPNPAELISVSVDGQRVIPAQTGYRFVVPPSQRDEMKLIEIQYRTPSEVAFLQDSHTLIIPQVEQTVLDISYRFAFAPHMQLNSVSPAVRLGTFVDEASWSDWLFGPMNRHTELSMFNPFSRKSWSLLFAGTTKAQSEVVDDLQSFAPAEWIVHKIEGPELSSAFQVQLVHSGRVELLAWQGFLLSLIGGLLLRIRKPSIRNRVGIYWITFWLTIMWFVSPVYAGVVGGCLMGSVMAILFPRKLLSPWKIQEMQPHDLSVGLGSTETIQKMPATLVLLFAIVLVPAAFAQESSSPDLKKEIKQNSGNDDTGIQFDVLIPVRAGENSPVSSSPVVYVSPDFLDYFLDKAAKDPQLDPQYLISSVQYTGVVEDQAAITLSTVMRVVLLSPEGRVRVMLPFVNPNFGGEKACRVDNQPHPILHDTRKDTFYIDLENDGSLQSLKIELTLHPPTTAISGGGTFELGIPQVPSSDLSLQFSGKTSTMNLVDARGEIVVSSDKKSLKAQLGKTDKIHFLWSENNLPAAVPPSYEARILYSVDVQSGWFQYRIRVAYEQLKGTLEHVVWQLPPEAIVREVTSNEPIMYNLEKSDDEFSQLFLQFSKPRSKDFAIDLVVTLPVHFHTEEVVIPKIDLLGLNSENETQKVTSIQVGISTVTGLNLKLLSEESDDFSLIEIDEYMKAWGESESIRRSAVAIRLQSPVELKFQIDSLSAVRKIRQSQVGRIKGSRLDWTLTAEIETTTAPAYHHTLKLDPRLRIDRISIVEDEAERLVRWSRFRDRLVLFLGGKTTGIQSLVLKANLPVDRFQNVELPKIIFEDAEIVDSRLTLYHETGLDVELSEAEELLPMDANLDSSSANKGEELLGRFRISESTVLPKIQISEHRENLPSESVSFLQELSDGRFKLSYVFRFQDSDVLSKSVRFRLPEEITGNYEVLPENIPHREDVLTDGSIDLIVEPTFSIDKTSFVYVSTELIAPTSGSWQLPNLNSYLEESENILAVASNENEISVLPENAEYQTVELPRWIQEIEGLELDFNKITTFRSQEDAWLLSISRLQRSVKKTEYPMIETKIWFDLTGKTQGRTGIYVLSPRNENLEFSWTENTNLLAVFVDGQQVETNGEQAIGLSIPLHHDSSMHTVTLFWNSHEQSNLPILGSVIKQIPLPVDALRDHVILTISPSSFCQVESKQGWIELNTVDRSLAYLDGLLFVNTRSVEATGTVYLPAWEKLVAGHQRLRQQFLSSPNRENSNEVTRRKRYSKIGEQIEVMREQSGVKSYQTENRIFSEIDRMAFSLESVDSPNLIHGRMTQDELEPTISFWVIDHRLRNTLFAVMTLVVAIPLILRLQHVNVGDWIAKHIDIIWVIFGLIWWIYLTLSIIGLLLFLIAFAVTVRNRMRAKTSPSIILD